MKSLLPLIPLLFAACAPKAILLLDAGDAPPGASTRPTDEPVSEAETGDSPTLSDRPGDDLGLLEPRDLTRLPDEREMRATVEPEEPRPVIATPPATEE